MSRAAIHSAGVMVGCSTKGEKPVRYVIHAGTPEELTAVMRDLGFGEVPATSMVSADIFVFPPAKPTQPE